MRHSKVVLSDDEIVAQMRAAAPANEGAGAIQARIDDVLAERLANQEAVQADYDKGRGTDFGTAAIVAQSKLYPVKEHKGPITAVYKPGK